MDIFRFTVEGAGSFPFDMLRFDNACPAAERESGKLEHHQNSRRQVVLHSTNQPTPKRWESFCWRVVSDVEKIQ